MHKKSLATYHFILNTTPRLSTLDSRLIMPDELIAFLLSMLPLTELRGGIPYAVGVLEMPPYHAFLWATLGNIFVAILILKLLDPISQLLRKYSKWFDNFFDKLFKKTHSKHAHKFIIWGEIFLVIFVMIPLPGSGAWTGSLVAFLLGIEFWKSLCLITVGLVLSGILITLATTGVISGLQVLL